MREPKPDGWIAALGRRLLDWAVLAQDRVLGIPTRKAVHNSSRPEIKDERLWGVDFWMACSLILVLLAVGYTSVTNPIDDPFAARELSAHLCASLVLALLIALRILGVVMVALSFPISDLHGRRRPTVRSSSRVILLGILNYIEIWLAFGFLYGAFGLIERGGSSQCIDDFDALYFSAVTQLTIGYGDVHPSDFGRFCVVLQGFTSLIVLLFNLGRFIGCLRREESSDVPSARLVAQVEDAEIADKLWAHANRLEALARTSAPDTPRRQQLVRAADSARQAALEVSPFERF